MLFKKEGKKATAALEDSLLFLFDLIILAIAGAVLLTTVSSLVNNPLLEERTVAADLALYLDTLYAAPGSVFGIYSQQSLSFMASIDQGAYNTVTVKVDKDAKALGNYVFHPDTTLINSFATLNTSKPASFVRQDGTMTGSISGNAKFINHLLFAPVPEISKPLNIRVYAAQNADEIQQSMGTGTKITLPTRAEQVTDAKIANMILVVDVQSYGEGTAKLFIPQNSPASRYLASLIEQQLAFPYSSIIPISPGFLAQDDPAQILRSSVPSVLVSVSSTGVSPNAVASAIDKATQQYLKAPQPAAEAKPNVKRVGDVNIIAPSRGEQQ